MRFLMRKRQLRRAFQCTYVGCGAHFNAHTSVAARISMCIRRLRHAFQCAYVGCGTHFNVHTSVAARFSMHIHQLRHAFQCTYIRCSAPFNVQNTGCGACATHDGLLWRRIKAMQGLHIRSCVPAPRAPHSVLKCMSGPRKLTQAGTARRRPRHDARRAIAPRRRASYCANAKNMQVCIDNRFVILYNLTTDSYLLCMKQPHVLHTAQPLFRRFFKEENAMRSSGIVRQSGQSGPDSDTHRNPE